MADPHDLIREYWDRDADVYDRTLSHSVSHPAEAAVWRAVLARYLPPPPARVLDVGAGTGSISLLAAELGHRVTALDISPGMLLQARRKAAERGLAIDFVVGPATEPPPGPFDAVVERHVLWTTPDPVSALTAWRAVAPGGRLLLLEGRWGGPLHTVRSVAARAIGRVFRVPPDHHAPYPAGWTGIGVRRLREAERARRRASPRLLGRLEHVRRYAIVAEA